jgi:ribonuclease R
VGNRQDRIVEHLSAPDYRPVKVRTLAREMEIPEEEYVDFRREVEAMIDTGALVEGRGANLRLPAGRRDEVVGVYRANPRGFGFVEPTAPVGGSAGESPDIFIPPGAGLDAVEGDTVVVRVSPHEPARGRARAAGAVVRVLARGMNRVVGPLAAVAGGWVVRPDGKKFAHDVFVADAGAAGAKPGDKVVAELIKFPNAFTGGAARGVIVEVLGRPGEPGVDSLSIIRQYGIPDRFAEEVLEEARAAAAQLDDAAYEGRTDLRPERVITIDPATARDFDDAVSIDRQSDGTWLLGVHIADVAHFVGEGTALDRAARERGNSVYLPRRVEPMLPEVLSNGVCSLQEGVDRLTKTAVIHLSKDGKVLSRKFADTVIRNRRRFTYEQVTEVLAGREGLAEPDVVELIFDMDRLAKILLQRRRDAGQHELELPDVELIYDEGNRVVDAEPENRDFSHRIIEMFMLEANEAVAAHFARLNIPTLRRIHEEPNEEALLSLAKFLRPLGFRMKDPTDRFELQSILRAAAGTPREFAVHMAALRSMKRATYSPDLEGHYALASEHYLHFTSPIRRYPDLIVHRELGRLNRRGAPARRLPDDEDRIEQLGSLGRHCSMTERRAEDAEAEYKLVKVLELMETLRGGEIDGTVSGVAGFGVFVQSTKFLIDGVVPLSSMADDYYEVYEETGAVIGRRTKKMLRIGDAVRVRIAAVDVPRRKLTFAIAAWPVRRSGEPGPGGPGSGVPEASPGVDAQSPRRHGDSAPGHKKKKGGREKFDRRGRGRRR